MWTRLRRALWRLWRGLAWLFASCDGEPGLDAGDEFDIPDAW